LGLINIVNVSWQATTKGGIVAKNPHNKGELGLLSMELRVK